MTKKVFEEQMSIIAANFGSAEYTKDRVALIYDIVKDLPDENFKKIVKFFLETKSVKWPPLPSDFREQYYNQKKTIFSETKKQISTDTHPADLKSSQDVIKNLKLKYGVNDLAEIITKRKQERK